jgi:nucleotide-binding universal stress UspA family protein
MNKKMKILIAYDGSDCAEAALDDLQRAGLPRKAEALVVSVAEAWLLPPPSAYEIVAQAREVHVPSDLKRVYPEHSPAVYEAQSLADRAATRLRTNFPGWDVFAIGLLGSPASELVRKADEWLPDLFVIGSHGRSFAGRLILGSVSQRVLTESRCSVRIARGRVEEPDTPVRILIGTDGSPASKAAVREAASRTWPPKSEVLVVAVTDPLTPTLIGRVIPAVGKAVNESNAADNAWLGLILSDAAATLRSPDLKVATEICQGEPKRVLVDVAQKWRADSIFVGSIGFSNRLERFVLGSVSAAVAARAHCSVEVTKVQETLGDTNNE